MLYLNVDQEEVIRSAFEMPALPQSAVRLSHLVARDEIDLNEVVHVIECDPALTLKLLRIANSLYSSPSPSIGTVRDAVIRLGAGAILGLGIGSCFKPTIMPVLPGYCISGEDFWRHSIAAALTTECMRPFSTQRITSLAFTSALLHDVGKVVLGRYLNPEILNLMERAGEDGHMAIFEAENEILSLNHAEVGSLIAQHWGLPDPVIQGVLYHHSPEMTPDSMARVTHFANFVAHRVVEYRPVDPSHLFVDKDLDDVQQDLIHFGIKDADSERIIRAVTERLAVISGGFK